MLFGIPEERGIRLLALAQRLRQRHGGHLGQSHSSAFSVFVLLNLALNSA